MFHWASGSCREFAGRHAGAGAENLEKFADSFGVPLPGLGRQTVGTSGKPARVSNQITIRPPRRRQPHRAASPSTS
jgi:hypothetical protein